MSEKITEYIFNDNAIKLLALRLRDSDTPQDFLAEVDELANDRLNLLRLPEPIVFAYELDGDDDGSNAVKVLEAIGFIDRARAADPRLWSYLALVTLRDYMTVRWRLNTAKNFKQNISDHWLMTSPSRRKMVRHGIARLWWIANLTYDPKMKKPLSQKEDDPFAYAKWVFENENRRQSIFERQLGASPRVMWAILEAAAESDASDQSQLIKDIAKDVNLNAAYRNLETLEQDKLVGLIGNGIDD